MTKEEIKAHVESQRLLLEEKIRKKKVADEQKKKDELEQKRKQREEKLRLENEQKEKEEHERMRKKFEEEQARAMELAAVEEAETAQENSEFIDPSNDPADDQLSLNDRNEENKYEDMDNREPSEENFDSTFQDREYSDEENAETVKRHPRFLPHEEEAEGEEDAAYDYNTQYGLSDAKFMKIQEQMKLNDESPNKLRESREKHVIEDEDKDDNDLHHKDSVDNQERYRIQFDIKSKVENLKKKIQKQNKMKLDKNKEAKLAAFDMLFSKKKTEKEVEEQRSEESDNSNKDNYQYDIDLNAEQHYANLISPTQKDSLHEFNRNNFKDNIKPNLPSTNSEVAYFQRSTKFDSMPVIDHGASDDIYEEDFEDDIIEENTPDRDDLDRNMELPIPNAPINNRYQQTFGVSEDSFADVSGMNPLEESEYTNKITPKKIAFNDTIGMEDN